jgi:uncharacterized protein (TIGR00369 family)
MVRGALMEPTGMFMEAVRRGLPAPPAARTLGFQVIDVDPGEGRIEVAFEGGEAFTNPFGEVLGGFLSAMLYDTVGPALLATLSRGEFIVTHELRTTFVRPAGVGRFVGRGRVVRRDGDRAVLEATLLDSEGQVVATAEATAEVVRRDPPGHGEHR